MKIKTKREKYKHMDSPHMDKPHTDNSEYSVYVTPPPSSPEGLKEYSYQSLSIL
jgi:hypothetical protein